MSTLLNKYSTVISILLLLAFLILIWLLPAKGVMLGMIFLLLSFVIAGSTVVAKHGEAHRQGRLTRFACVRNILLDLSGILLAIILAALLSRYIAEIATRQISHTLTRLIAGIVIGLLVGIGVGVFVHRTASLVHRTASLVRQTWGRFVKTAR